MIDVVPRDAVLAELKEWIQACVKCSNETIIPALQSGAGFKDPVSIVVITVDELQVLINNMKRL